MIPSSCLEVPVRFPKVPVKFVFSLIFNSGGGPSDFWLGPSGFLEGNGQIVGGGSARLVFRPCKKTKV